jgi:phage-related minor tail protein
MSEATDSPTHGEILRAIGKIEGRLDAILTAMSQNRSDITEAFRRLGEAEKRIAQGIILAFAVSLVMPIVVMIAAPRLEFGPKHHPNPPVPMIR